MNRDKQKSNSRNRRIGKYHKGDSLIEILVTLIIMAVGLLGLASMQMISLKNINNSQFRSLATNYAYDMAERMRANKTGVTSGEYDALSTDDANETTCSACSSAETAQLDEYEWAELITQDVVSGGLPSGSGTVTANGDVYDINIQWDEQGRDSDGGKIDTSDFTLTVQL